MTLWKGLDDVIPKRHCLIDRLGYWNFDEKGKRYLISILIITIIGRFIRLCSRSPSKQTNRSSSKSRSRRATAVPSCFESEACSFRRRMKNRGEFTSRTFVERTKATRPSTGKPLEVACQYDAVLQRV
eukprot:scaffold29919_cov70-Cyclotella_meneghiniana.AAC.4